MVDPHFFLNRRPVLRITPSRDSPGKIRPYRAPLYLFYPKSLADRGNTPENHGNSPGTIRSCPAGTDEVVFGNVKRPDRPSGLYSCSQTSPAMGLFSRSGTGLWSGSRPGSFQRQRDKCSSLSGIAQPSYFQKLQDRC